MQRYQRATGPDGWLTADGWVRLARDLHAYADLIVGESEMRATRREPSLATYCRDRADDCRSRAAALTRTSV